VACFPLTLPSRRGLGMRKPRKWVPTYVPYGVNGFVEMILCLDSIFNEVPSDSSKFSNF
jgi:hypothetical protein